MKDTLAALGASVRDHFAGTRRMLSFAEYLELALADPARQLRGSVP